LVSQILQAGSSPQHLVSGGHKKDTKMKAYELEQEPQFYPETPWKSAKELTSMTVDDIAIRMFGTTDINSDTTTATPEEMEEAIDVSNLDSWRSSEQKLFEAVCKNNPDLPAETIFNHPKWQAVSSLARETFFRLEYGNGGGDSDDRGYITALQDAAAGKPDVFQDNLRAWFLDGLKTIQSMPTPSPLNLLNL
jgi:hypothetical protein